jgi:hypothetical protein
MSEWDKIIWTFEDIGKIAVDPLGIWYNDTQGAPILSKDDVKDIITLPGTVITKTFDTANKVVDTVDNAVGTAGDTLSSLGSSLSTPLLVIGGIVLLMQLQK